MHSNFPLSFYNNFFQRGYNRSDVRKLIGYFSQKQEDLLDAPILEWKRKSFLQGGILEQLDKVEEDMGRRFEEETLQHSSSRIIYLDESEKDILDLLCCLFSSLYG